MKIYIVILHYGDISVTKNCIASLKKYERRYGKIVVVNNDLRQLTVKDFQDKDIIIINNKTNKGFAGGVNSGIVYAFKEKADAVLLLNNDTIIKKPFIRTLVEDLEKYPEVGIVGPAISFEKNKQTLFDIGGHVSMLTGRTYHTEVMYTKGLTSRSVVYISAAAMLICKEVFEKIGMFDEQFFLYYEDVDFCLRAQKAGFQIVVDPSVSMYHLLSKNVGKINTLAVYHQTKSAILFGKKYLRRPIQKWSHFAFLFAQTLVISCKNPCAGFAGWKALFCDRIN